MANKKKSDWIAALEKRPDLQHGAHVTVCATEWLALLQFNKKMPNSVVARKMKTTRKHVEDIMGGSQPSLPDLAAMFYALGYKLRIYAEDIETGKKHMQPPEPLPHTLRHPHIRRQLQFQSEAKITKSRR
jgi:hypothetical protein